MVIISMKVEGKCFAKTLVNLWCISISESESEDDVDDAQENISSMSLNPEPNIETIIQSGTKERPKNDCAVSETSVEKDGSVFDDESNPLIEREFSVRWKVEEIHLETTISQLTNGVFGQKIIEIENIVVSRKARSSTERNREYLVEDLIWQSVSGHPNILPLFAKFYNSPNFSYNVISHYLPIVNLQKLIKIRKVLNTKVSKVVIAQIASAICFLHNKDIFHRDVQSKNILICSGKTKLSNFRNSVNSRTSHGLHGHFFYQAPEILSGETYDITADWFALGTCLYEMSMSHTPIENHCMRYDIKFEEIDYYGKIAVLLNCTYYIPKVFPEGLKRALKDFLQKDPTKRLGHKDNLEEFKNHPFFSNIKWNQLESGSLTAPLPKKEEIQEMNKIKLSPFRTRYD